MSSPPTSGIRKSTITRSARRVWISAMAARPPAHVSHVEAGALGEPGHDVENALFVVDDDQQRSRIGHAPPTLSKITAANASPERPQLERRHEQGARLLVTELLESRLRRRVDTRTSGTRHVVGAAPAAMPRESTARIRAIDERRAQRPRAVARQRLVGADRWRRRCSPRPASAAAMKSRSPWSTCATRITLASDSAGGSIRAGSRIENVVPDLHLARHA